MAIRLLLPLLLLPSALAHFTVLTPTPLGNDIEGEETSPCGGYTPDLSSSSTNIQTLHANGEPFSIQTGHPQSTWLLRATLDSAASKGWIGIYPIFQQTGVGKFCISNATIPSNFVGQNGVVGIVSNGEDGMLYQCIAAKFVNGTASADSNCSTASSVTLAETSDPDLSAMLGTPSDSSSNSSHDDSAAVHVVCLRQGLMGLVAVATGALVSLW